MNAISTQQLASHALVMGREEVLAVISGQKRQVRFPLTIRNTLCNGMSWHKPNFARAVWEMAFVDPGPSPAGNAGPYLHVAWPAHGDMLGGRVYPRFSPGERLLIQEDWASTTQFDGKSAKQMAQACIEAGYRRPWAPVVFAADGDKRNWEADFIQGEPRSARHMPTWLSRLSLRITEIRIERLRSISTSDIRAEASQWINPPISGLGVAEADLDELGLILGFMADWDGRHANLDHKWTANPWVIALTFSP